MIRQTRSSKRKREDPEPQLQAQEDVETPCDSDVKAIKIKKRRQANMLRIDMNTSFKPSSERNRSAAVNMPKVSPSPGHSSPQPSTSKKLPRRGAAKTEGAAAETSLAIVETVPSTTSTVSEPEMMSNDMKAAEGGGKAKRSPLRPQIQQELEGCVPK